MTTDIHPPCAHCPFRARFQGDRDYLRAGRRLEIVRSVMGGASFPCHETVTHNDDDEYVPSRDETDCVGLDIVMAREHLTGQLVRIRERIGLLNPEVLLQRSRRMKMWTWDEIQADAHPTPQDGDVCSVVGPDCTAPAGHLIGGQAVVGTEFTDNVCGDCGEFVCEECMDCEDHMCWEYNTAIDSLRHPPRVTAPPADPGRRQVAYATNRPSKRRTNQ